MTPEAQRIAIAKACGWKHDYDETYLMAFWSSPKGERLENCPDYPSDLNAMAQAEETLSPHCNDNDLEEERNAQRYEHVLISVLHDTDPFLGASLGDLWHATAAQRAEAFLRCIGKWIE